MCDVYASRVQCDGYSCVCFENLEESTVVFDERSVRDETDKQFAARRSLCRRLSERAAERRLSAADLSEHRCRRCDAWRVRDSQRAVRNVLVNAGSRGVHGNSQHDSACSNVWRIGFRFEQIGNVVSSEVGLVAALCTDLVLQHAEHETQLSVAVHTLCVCRLLSVQLSKRFVDSVPAM